MTFEEIYGEFGKEFAEAHHIIPLSKLRGRVERSPDDSVPRPSAQIAIECYTKWTGLKMMALGYAELYVIGQQMN